MIIKLTQLIQTGYSEGKVPWIESDVYVNTDCIIWMEPYKNGTALYLTNRFELNIKETPQQILELIPYDPR